MSDRHDLCECGHERSEHGPDGAGDGADDVCRAIVDPRRIDDEFCRCQKFAGAQS